MCFGECFAWLSGSPRSKLLCRSGKADATSFMMSQPPARLAIKCAQLQLGEVRPVSAFRDHGDHRDQGPLGEQLAWYASSELLGVAGESCWAPMAHVVGTIAAIVSGQRPPLTVRGTLPPCTRVAERRS